jgi:hypothetical protein
MRRYAFLSILALFCAVLPAQQIGKWTVYAAYHHSTYNIPLDDKVYALYDGSLLSYSKADGEVQTYSKADVLSDNKITHIAWNESQKKLLIVYSNANVDILYADGTVKNLTEFKNKTITDKTVNCIWMDGDYAYLATNFGLLVVNMAKEEFSQTYEFSSPVVCCAVLGTKIYAGTAKGLCIGNTADNLLDPANWNLVSYTTFTHMAVFDGYVFGVTPSRLVHIDPTTYYETGETATAPTILTVNHGQMVASGTSFVRVYTSATSYKDYGGTFPFRHLAYGGDATYWANPVDQGLQAYKLDAASGTFTAQGSPLEPNSPVRNYCDRLSYTAAGRLLVAGGSLNYYGLTFEGTAMQYDGGTWTNFQEDSIASLTGHPYVNLTSIVQDPADATHHFVSSSGQGLYEFRNYKYVGNYNQDNSSLRSIFPTDDAVKNDYVRILGLNYDASGNLWMLNTQVDTVLKVRRTDGSWLRVYEPLLKGNPTMDQIMFDKRGWVWVNSRRFLNDYSEAGVFCLQYGGSLDGIASDPAYFHGTIINQDAVSYTPNELYCMAEDRNGSIWVGSNLGPFLIEDPTAFGNDGFTYTQVKVPRNDGSQYADYLLSGIGVTSIAIDGGNRKWFGTESDGVYLVSADNLTTLHHFTTDNSPLLSNNINSVAVNPLTGEVMIGTADGLVSYMSDATEPSEALTSSNVRAYPNPVKPDYEGVVTVVGLTADADVQVVTATGQLVAAGTSVGGTFTWNGKDRRGRRVTTGVYNVMSVTADGKKGVVTKVVVIK